MDIALGERTQSLGIIAIHAGHLIILQFPLFQVKDLLPIGY